MDKYDVEMPASSHPRRFNVGFHLDAEGLRLENYRGPTEPAQHANDQRQVKEVQFEQRAKHDKEGNPGQSDKQVCQPHKKGVQQAPVVG